MKTALLESKSKAVAPQNKSADVGPYEYRQL